MKYRKSMNFYQNIYLLLLEKSNVWDKQHIFPGGLKHKEDTFYIIRRSGMKPGLFSHFRTNLARIDYAINNGMIPIVDMQNFKNSNLEEEEYCLVNAWEKYFQQPIGYTLEDAYSAKNIILSDAGVPKDFPRDSMDFFADKNGELTYWRKICREYIHLSPIVEQCFLQQQKLLFGDGKRILGVLARGTDYVKVKPSKHAIQPTAEQIIDKSKEVMVDYTCDKLFLVTEDKNIANRFAEEFGDKCLTNVKEYLDYEDGYLSEIDSEKKGDKFERGLEYLVNILLLSKCNCVVSGRTSGAVGAALFTDGWEYSYFFDLGRYE